MMTDQPSLHTNPAVNWGAEAWRAPTLEEGDTLLFDECGRSLQYGRSERARVDCRSHWFQLVRARFGGVYLLVHHGGGEERIELGYEQAVLLDGIAGLTSDQRYLLLHTMLNVAHETAREATQATAKTYRKAFVEGRLKKRKQRGADTCKVWIEP